MWRTQQGGKLMRMQKLLYLLASSKTVWIMISKEEQSGLQYACGLASKSWCIVRGKWGTHDIESQIRTVTKENGMKWNLETSLLPWLQAQTLLCNSTNIQNPLIQQIKVTFEPILRFEIYNAITDGPNCHWCDFKVDFWAVDLVRWVTQQ